LQCSQLSVLLSSLKWHPCLSLLPLLRRPPVILLLPPPVSPSPQPSSPDTPLTVAQTFALHSRPNATRKILLDFDGHVTTGTAWNNAKGKDPIITPPYDKVRCPQACYKPDDCF
jgi:hypothetical protein